MPDETVWEHASGMADALADGTWRTWSQEQAQEVATVLDRLREGASRSGGIIEAVRKACRDVRKLQERRLPGIAGELGRAPHSATR